MHDTHVGVCVLCVCCVRAYVCVCAMCVCVCVYSCVQEYEKQR